MLGDESGYFAEPYRFYFEKGINTLTLVGRREPVMISSLRLLQAKDVPTYTEIKAEYAKRGYQATEGIFIKVQGQHAKYKSDPTLYPVFDQGDPTVEPYHPAEIRLNTIGGWRWQTADSGSLGMWKYRSRDYT